MNFFKNAAVVGCLLFLVAVISPAFDSSISRLLTHQRLRWGLKEIAMSADSSSDAHDCSDGQNGSSTPVTRKQKSSRRS
jgi:hypothetical protein